MMQHIELEGGKSI